jgi:hypothetical protein
MAAKSTRKPRGKAAKPKPQAAGPPAKKLERKAGRSADYTPELGARICEETATGGKLAEICLLPGMPDRTTIYRWFARHPDFAEAYKRARQARALLRSDKIDDIVDKMLDGTLDPQAGRAAIDALKWQAAKEDPRNFGDKVEISGKDGGPIQTKDVTLLELARDIAYTLHRASAAMDLPAVNGAALPPPAAAEGKEG